MKRFAIAVLAATAVLAAVPARADEAAAIFQKKCSACHGKDGKGQTKMGEKMGIKDLSTAPGAAEIEKIVADGKNKMPAFKGKLPDEEIKALASYIKAGLK
jgi:cytochrome c6